MFSSIKIRKTPQIFNGTTQLKFFLQEAHLQKAISMNLTLQGSYQKWQKGGVLNIRKIISS